VRQALQHPEDVDGLLGGLAPGRSGGDQGAAGLQLLQQPGHSLLLVHGGVGHGQLEVPGQFGERFAVAAALLADVEGCQGEAEDLHLADQPLQRFATDARLLQAVTDQFEIAAEILVGAVVQFLGLVDHGQTLVAHLLSLQGCLPAGFGDLAIALEAALQSLVDVGELQAVGLKAIAGGQPVVDLGEPQAVHLEGFEQGGAHLAPLHRDGELLLQLGDRAQVALQHPATLEAGRPPGDVRRHGGVAVPVGSHPGPESAESR
jgi:hypothetical protein